MKKKTGIMFIAACAAAAALIAGSVKVYSDSVKQNAVHTMAAMTDEKAQSIKDFVKDTEHLITEYSEADEITKLLCDPDNKELAYEAQSFTEAYSAQIEDLNGIYASRYDTCVLTHTDSSLIGIITRSNPDTRDALHEALESADDGIYRAGIIISPANGTQVLSMYRIVRNQKNEPAGYTGIGIRTESFRDQLQPQAVKGTKNTAFSLLSAANAKYLISKDDSLIGKETGNAQIKSLCSEVSGKSAPKNGTLEYQENGEKHLVSYSYMPEYDWLLMMDAVM